jgi:hypothetical protein
MHGFVVIKHLARTQERKKNNNIGLVELYKGQGVRQTYKYN